MIPAHVAERPPLGRPFSFWVQSARRYHPDMSQTPDAPAVRLDLWLWAARFYKTRALAKQAIEGGKVDVQGQGAKPSRLLKPGDGLRVQRGEDVFEIEVVSLS